MSGAQPGPTTPIVLYGIDNCDTCRLARRWLGAHAIAHRFHDIRRDGLPRTTLESWLSRIAWDERLNRRGQTWRRLPLGRRHLHKSGSTQRCLGLCGQGHAHHVSPCCRIGDGRHLAHRGIQRRCAGTF